MPAIVEVGSGIGGVEQGGSVAPQTPALDAHGGLDLVDREFLHIEMDGPAAIRKAILPTNLGTMLGGMEARFLWPKVWRTLAMVWGTENDQDQADFEDFKNRLLRYDGRVSSSG